MSKTTEKRYVSSFEDNVENLANRIMFSESANLKIADYNVHRKNKSNADINAALRKAARNGKGKTEFELDWFKLYLKSIVKSI